MKTNNVAHETAAHTHVELHHPHELPFWRKSVFSTDHKVIGLQYAFKSVFVLFFGLGLIVIIQCHLA